MEIEYLNDSNKQEWDDFCDNCDMAWFRHTTTWQQYIEHCRWDSNAINLSFMVKQNKTIVAIVPLISQYIYGDESNNEFANYDTPTPYFAMLPNNEFVNREKLVKFIMEHIESLYEKYNIKKVRYFVDPLTVESPYNNFAEFNMLQFGFKPDLYTTNIIDLTQPLDVILRHMRKGHKAAVKAVAKLTNFKAEIYDSKNITKDILGIYKKIHTTDAGRQTRKDESWDDMLSWIQSDYAFLVLIKDLPSNEYKAGGFFITYKKRCFYGTYATLDDYYLNGHVGIEIQWTAIQHLVKLQNTHYELGWTFYPANFSGAPDHKVMELGKYKRGFGGHEHLLLTYSKNIHKSAET